MTEDRSSSRRSAWGIDTSDPKQSWREKALCAQVDPELFFPDKSGSTREAKSVCAGCEVRAECLNDALAHDDRFGIRGGLSERERRKLKRPPLPRIRGTSRALNPPTRHPQCGTEAGAKKHSREGEYSCQACKDAGTEARRKRLTA